MSTVVDNLNHLGDRIETIARVGFFAITVTDERIQPPVSARGVVEYGTLENPEFPAILALAFDDIDRKLEDVARELAGSRLKR